MTFYPDVLPKILTDIRSDTGVAAITARIRSPEPAGPVIHPTTRAVIDKGDRRAGTADEPYVAFVVLRSLPAIRHPRVPLQFARIVAQCYGRTSAEAAELRWRVGDSIHQAGPRVYGNGLGIYNSLDDSGGEQQLDPHTQQPYQEIVIEVPATTQVVA